MTFAQPGFFGEQSHSHQKRTQKRKLTIFGNTKQVIQDYDTVFDNSIPFRKNDPLRITYFRIPGVPGPALQVCVFITEGPFTKLCAWGRRRVEDMCYEIRRAEACVD